MSVQVSAKHKVFVIPFSGSEHIAHLVPEARIHGDKLILPHTRDTVRLARNFGHKVPAPILSQYDWNGDKPFRTQMTTAAMLTMQSRAYVLSQMGTGKTRATLHAINFMLMQGEIKRVLVVAPLSTLVPVWDTEIFRYFNHLSTGILHGHSRDHRLKVLAQDHHIYIINHDGVETILKELLDVRFDVVVIDELATFRNASNDKWKALNLLVNGGLRRGQVIPLNPAPYAWGLTGSPTPNEASDAWGQCRLLSPAKVPPFFKQFQRQTMHQLTQFKWIEKPDAKETVYAAMQPAVRYKRDDCVELPPTVNITRQVKPSTEQERVYKDLMKKLKLAFAEGTVTAANEGVLFSKLLQIASGYVYTQDKRVVSLDNKGRMDALLEILDEAEGKVIVFVEFIHVAEHVFRAVQNAGHTVDVVTGQTPPRYRNDIFAAFQGAAFPRVLVMHPRCSAHGLTLTAADTIVWFTPTTSLEIYEQANARITRPGQTRKTLLIHLEGMPVEAKLYRRLRQKSATQGALLELFEAD